MISLLYESIDDLAKLSGQYSLCESIKECINVYLEGQDISLTDELDDELADEDYTDITKGKTSGSNEQSLTEVPVSGKTNPQVNSKDKKIEEVKRRYKERTGKELPTRQAGESQVDYAKRRYKERTGKELPTRQAGESQMDYAKRRYKEKTGKELPSKRPDESWADYAMRRKNAQRK